MGRGHEGRTTGILPINLNTTSDGHVEKGQFLCLGPTTAECHDQLLRAKKDLPLDWSYVRD